jgi:phosphomannomutase
MEALSSVKISKLMDSSGVKFGTSGARGLVSDMSDYVCYSYTKAFLQHLEKLGELKSGMSVGVACDFRPSSPRITLACCQAISDFGCVPVNGGNVPTPAIALYGIQHQLPVLMVTGSHIPDDRNGIKFYRQTGEILKADEQAIRDEVVTTDVAQFSNTGMLHNPPAMPAVLDRVFDEYTQRFTDYFPAQALAGLKVAVYQHSSVASRSLLECLGKVGAETIPLAYSERFIPVDTEAVRDEDIRLARQWAGEYHYDAIVSTDGDGDRPLIGDEHGNWLRGDIVGILCAKYLAASTVVTPVSSNTAAEKSGYFTRVITTRIGSPYVIEAMQQAADGSSDTVVGYEANGGFLTQTTLHKGHNELSPLPTRDAILPMLAILHMAAMKQCAISELTAGLPHRFTYSDRIKDISTEFSATKLATLEQNNFQEFVVSLSGLYDGKLGRVQQIDTTDGLRVTLTCGNIIHLRPSGNAPELRCYTESDTEESAQQLNKACIEVMRKWQ